MESIIKQRIKERKSLHTNSVTCQFPQNMLLEVTNCCNDTCLFCANSKCTKIRGFIEPEVAKRILEKAYMLGTREVGFYGTGEPLLDHNLEEYISYAKKLGYEYVYITTNGALMTEERAKSLINAGIDSIKFSVNASNRDDYVLIHGQDDFDVIINNIKCLHELRKEQNRKVALYISYVVTRYTKQQKKEFVDKYTEYVDDIIFNDCVDIAGCMGNEITNWLSVDEKVQCPYENEVCPLIFKTLYVTYEGFLTMCCADFQNYLVIADLKKDDLEVAWNNEYAQNLRRQHLEHRTEGTLCYNCLKNCVSDVRPLREEYAIKCDFSTWDKTEEIASRVEKWKEKL